MLKKDGSCVVIFNAETMRDAIWLAVLLYLSTGLSYSTKNLSDLVQLNTDSVTVSGLSSGAYMAVQYSIAHSSGINGTAVFAGGPYYCAESSLILAESRCMSHFEGEEVAEELAKYTFDASVLGTIDDVENLKSGRMKFYLYSGKVDSVVDSSVMRGLESYLQLMEVSSASIRGVFDVESEHCLPTDGTDPLLEPCTTLSEPYIGKCNYDGAGDALKSILGGEDLKPRADMIAENLVEFSQVEYNIHGSLSSINDVGYIYIPTSCQSSNSNHSNCRLHVSFHGCKQNIQVIGDTYARHSGFNEWAEANDIVVMYPYVKPSLDALPVNPKGCWDWWGYTNDEYGLKSGWQIEFVHALVNAVVVDA